MSSGQRVSDCVRILTAPGGLPGFWMVARDAQANLLPHLESPVWLSRRRHKGEKKKSRQWAAIRRVSRRITEVTTEGNMNIDVTRRDIRGGTMTSGRLLECNGLKMTTRGQKKCHTKSTLTTKLYAFILKMSVISEGVGGGGNPIFYIYIL